MILAYLHITIKLYSKEVFIHTTEVHNVGLMNATKMICPVTMGLLQLKHLPQFLKQLYCKQV